jgi:hypothetical protein
LWSQIRELDPEYPDPQKVEEQILKGLRWRRWFRFLRTTKNGHGAEPVVELDAFEVVSGDGLVIPSGDLEIVHILPTAVRDETGWTALFEVKIAGGDGCSYTVYWDQEPVEFAVKDTEPDVAVIQVVGSEEGTIEGTVRVESGDQWSAQRASLQAPEHLWS